MHAAELIVDASLQAQSCPADVRKPALLWIARVETVVAPERARLTLQSGLEAAVGAPDEPHPLFEELSRMALAAVAPQLLTYLPPLSAESIFHGLPDLWPVSWLTTDTKSICSRTYFMTRLRRMFL